MKRLIENGKSLYTASCAYRTIDSVPESVRRLTAIVKERTGADIPLAAYDEKGTLRALWTSTGVRAAAYRADGTMSDLYTAQGFHFAHFHHESGLWDVYG